VRSVLIILLVVCVGCSAEATPIPPATMQALQQNPLPTPAYVHMLSTVVTPSAWTCMVDLRTPIIWETGEFDDDVTNRMQRTLRLTIDGQRIYDVTFAELNLLVRYNSQNTPVGSHSSNMRICVESISLTSGAHHAVLEFSSRSGNVYRHEWVLKCHERR
jgi:hypothetical protein